MHGDHFGRVKLLLLCLCILLEEAPGQQRREAVEHTGGQVEDGAEAGLQSCGATSVDHHHLVDLFRILVGQEGTERHTGRAEQRAGYRTGRKNHQGKCHLLVTMYVSGKCVGIDSSGILTCKYWQNIKHTLIHQKISKLCNTTEQL